MKELVEVIAKALVNDPDAVVVARQEKDDEIVINIGRRKGEYSTKPKNRIWEVYVHNTVKPVKVVCGEDGCGVEIVDRDAEK